MKKCLGCGVKLQSVDNLGVGYTPNIENNICARCFKVKNYGEVTKITTNIDDYLSILKNISKTNDLVVYVVDILNINKDLNLIYKYLKNNIILVLNKRDVLPKSVKDFKLINYLKDNYNFLDIIILSTLKNYNLDLLYLKINQYKTSKNVYFVGETNAGKSSLINKLVGVFSLKNSNLTESNMPETTLNLMKIKLNDNLNIIDTPGIVLKNNIINYLDSKYYKILNPKREIKPKTFQIINKQSIVVGDFLRIDYLGLDKNSFTFYITNDIKIKKVSLKNEYLKDLDFKYLDFDVNNDLVIAGLGFVKMVFSGKIRVYLDKNIEIFLRKNLI